MTNASPKVLSHKGWNYRFKISLKTGRLVMERTCPEAGLEFTEAFDFDFWPYHERAFRMDEFLRKLSVPALARRHACKLVQS